MEDAGFLVVMGGIFMGIYMIIKASAQLLSSWRAQQAQGAEPPQDTASSEAADDESGKLENNREL